MESLKFLLEEIAQRLLQYFFEKGFDALTQTLGIERETLALFVAIPGLLVLLGSGIRKLRRWLTQDREEVR